MTYIEAQEIASRINRNTEHSARMIYDYRLDPDRRMIDGYDVEITVKSIPMGLKIK